MKVHHSGFWESQEAFLAGNTGAPDVQDEIRDSDMAESVSSPPQTA